MASFSTGISGLYAANKNLETIGNNVANASTVGFKQSRVEFADIYSQGGLMTSGAKSGNGVKVADISQQFTQGGTTFTQNSLDMAIDGSGFFIVKNNGIDTYTRAGTFGMDAEGFVVDNAGNRVQGFPTSDDDARIEVGAINDLYIPVANIEPNATTEVSASFNLDSRKETPSNYTFDPNDSDTYTHLYPSVIYDSLGNSHTLTQYFVKQPTYQPDLGVHARALQSMVGFSRYGSDYFADTAGTGTFPGDSNENPGATLDSDVDAAVNSGSSTFDFTADPAAAAGTDFIDSANATDNERGTQLQALHDQLKDIIDNGGHSGRVKEYYQEAYDAMVDYLPGLASGSVGGTAVDTEVYTGALEAIENASIQGGSIGYGNLDTLSGVVRTALLNDAGVVDPLTDNIKLTSVDNTAAPLDDVANIEALVTDLKAALNDLMNGVAPTLEFPAGTALNFTLNTSGTPTAEEKAIYKSALDLLNEMETTYDDGNGAVNPQAVVDILDSLESESADNRWQMHAFVDGEQVTDGNTNSPDYFSFNFTPFGELSEPLPKISIRDWVPRDTALNQNGSFDPQEFTIDLEGTTQFGGPFSATALKQDGYATGELSGLDVDKSGVINARYTNGTTRLIGQVAIATFRNEQGLTPVGGTAWRQSSDSGSPVVNEPGVGVAGLIQSNALEDSNVDLSQELVKMIIAQRDYQANAKTIQTADTITQTIINMR